MRADDSLDVCLIRLGREAFMPHAQRYTVAPLQRVKVLSRRGDETRRDRGAHTNCTSKASNTVWTEQTAATSSTSRALMSASNKPLASMTMPRTR